MAFITAKYQTNSSASRIVNSGVGTEATVKNNGPGRVYLSEYYGSVADGGVDTAFPGQGFPLEPGETLLIEAVKFQINCNSSDSSWEPSIVHVIFS